MQCICKIISDVSQYHVFVCITRYPSLSHAPLYVCVSRPSVYLSVCMFVHPVSSLPHSPSRVFFPFSPSPSLPVPLSLHLRPPSVSVRVTGSGGTFQGVGDIVFITPRSQVTGFITLHGPHPHSHP